MKKLLLPLAFLTIAPLAFAAEPIEGNWKTESGEIVAVQPCANGKFCLTVTTGKNLGKQIGTLTGSGTEYPGMVTDPSDGKTYAGSATVTNDTLKLKGCILRILCKSQTWSRQE